jgi:hypothetical protein
MTVKSLPWVLAGGKASASLPLALPALHERLDIGAMAKEDADGEQGAESDADAGVPEEGEPEG